MLRFNIFSGFLLVMRFFGNMISTGNKEVDKINYNLQTCQLFKGLVECQRVYCRCHQRNMPKNLLTGTKCLKPYAKY